VEAAAPPAKAPSRSCVRMGGGVGRMRVVRKRLRENSPFGHGGAWEQTRGARKKRAKVRQSVHFMASNRIDRGGVICDVVHTERNKEEGIKK